MDLEACGVRVAPVVAAQRAVGARRGEGPAEVGLNWVLAKGALPVVGVCCVHRALGWRLAPKAVAALEGAAEAARAWRLRARRRSARRKSSLGTAMKSGC